MIAYLNDPYTLILNCIFAALVLIIVLIIVVATTDRQYNDEYYEMLREDLNDEEPR